VGCDGKRAISTQNIRKTAQGRSRFALFPPPDLMPKERATTSPRPRATAAVGRCEGRHLAGDDVEMSCWSACAFGYNWFPGRGEAVSWFCLPIADMREWMMRFRPQGLRGLFPIKQQAGCRRGPKRPKPGQGKPEGSDGVGKRLLQAKSSEFCSISLAW